MRCYGLGEADEDRSLIEGCVEGRTHTAMSCWVAQERVVGDGVTSSTSTGILSPWSPGSLSLVYFWDLPNAPVTPQGQLD